MIIYIGFSKKSHKLFTNIICREYKHCAPVIIEKNTCKMYQFTKHNKITVINLKYRDIEILKKYGWNFIKYDIKSTPNISDIYAITCVQFTKTFCGIHNIVIQTPDAFLKYLIK